MASSFAGINAGSGLNDDANVKQQSARLNSGYRKSNAAGLNSGWTQNATAAPDFGKASKTNTGKTMADRFWMSFSQSSPLDAEHYFA